jgi:hypothetical protein
VAAKVTPSRKSPAGALIGYAFPSTITEIEFGARPRVSRKTTVKVNEVPAVPVPGLTAPFSR